MDAGHDAGTETRTVTRLPAWMTLELGDSQQEEKTRKRTGWVPSDHVKPKGLGHILMEKFPGSIRSKSLLSVTMQLGHLGEGS